MSGRRVAFLEGMKSEGGILQRKQGQGPLGMGIVPNIQERVNKILKR